MAILKDFKDFKEVRVPFACVTSMNTRALNEFIAQVLWSKVIKTQTSTCINK